MKWKLVPEEPSQQQVDAAWKFVQTVPQQHDTMRSIYSTMVAAAPQPDHDRITNEEETMKLSELIDKMRTDRPDEWSMDELACKARQLEDALMDARSGMRYIRETHGNLYGVGFDRVEEKATKALDA